MQIDQLQQLQSQLDRRLSMIRSADPKFYHKALLQVWRFLSGHEITKSVMVEITRRYNYQSAVRTPVGQHLIGGSDIEHAALCTWMIQWCTEREDFIELTVGGNYTDRPEAWHKLETFTRIFVAPLFDYLTEQLEASRMLLTLLIQYKHRCEWFRREELLMKWKGNTRKGEDLLALDLYEFLHDKGVVFHIQPQSASGRIDLVSWQTGEDRLVADAKIFNPAGSQNVGYIVKGFRQIYDYTNDYNEPYGYLVIFKTCNQGLSIATAQQQSSVPFVTHNNKTIFLLVVDLCEYEESASKRGKLESYNLAEKDLIESLSDLPPATPAK